MPTRNPITVERLVGVLRRSQTPKIIVEGETDVIIYRRLLEPTGMQHTVLHAAGGRNKLLSIYERRNEFAHVPVVFIADRDMWLFSGIKPEYDDIIWTHGYSIENDLYISAGLEDFLETHQTDEHGKILDAVCTWFAFEVEAFLKGDPAYVAEGLDEIVPRGRTNLNDEFCERRSFLPPQEKRYQQIREAYALHLRGKLLFQILLRFLNATDRELRFQTTHHGLLAIAMDRPISSRLFDKLRTDLHAKLEEQKPEMASQTSVS